jgi:hypothetical protein
MGGMRCKGYTEGERSEEKGERNEEKGRKSEDGGNLASLVSVRLAPLSSLLPLPAGLAVEDLREGLEHGGDVVH